MCFLLGKEQLSTAMRCWRTNDPSPNLAAFSLGAVPHTQGIAILNKPVNYWMPVLWWCPEALLRVSTCGRAGFLQQAAGAEVQPWPWAGGTWGPQDSTGCEITVISHKI